MRMRRSYEGRAIFGLLLVGWGILALLDNFGLVEMRELFRTYWPVLIIVWGMTRVSFGHPGGRWLGVVAIAIGALFLGNTLLGWDINPANLWPLFLIGVGVRIMMRGRWGPPRRPRVSFEHDVNNVSNGPVIDGEPTVETDATATIREFALLGGVERRNTSQTFRGGEATAVLGGVEIDLRECRMADNEAVVDVFACLGGITFRIPRDWTVESQVSAILGGFHDSSTPPADGTVKRFVISGQAVMGGIEIKN
jgi:hypothetical protein